MVLRDTFINRSALTWSVQMAETVIQHNTPSRWHYEHALVHKAIESVGHITGNPVFINDARQYITSYIDEEGKISTYSAEDYNLDQINPGKNLFSIYHATDDNRYKQAAFHLYEQLVRQPRTSAGGFWHKKIYPHQMWLDGVFMAAPFYAQLAKEFDMPECFDDIALQVLLMEKNTRDPQTGLLYHGWDESRQQRWANPQTGCSPHFWGRAMGWYAMGVIDILDYFPWDHPQASGDCRSTKTDLRRHRALPGSNQRVMVSGVGSGPPGRKLPRSIRILHVYLYPRQSL